MQNWQGPVQHSPLALQSSPSALHSPPKSQRNALPETLVAPAKTQRREQQPPPGMVGLQVSPTGRQLVGALNGPALNATFWQVEAQRSPQHSASDLQSSPA